MVRWDYGDAEFVDTVSIPPHTSLISKIRLDDPVGGFLAVGRWLFYCHFLQHAERGMVSELIVNAPEYPARPGVGTLSASLRSGHLR